MKHNINKKKLSIFFFTAINIASLLTFSILRWQEIKQMSVDDHISNITLAEDKAHTILSSQEIILDMLGYRLINYLSVYTKAEEHPLLNSMLELNPGIISLSLARPNGDLVFSTSNIKARNYLKDPISSSSFIESLKSEKIVLGRTYYMQGFSDLIITIRKAIRDHNKNVVAIISADIKIINPDNYTSEGDYNKDQRIIIMTNKNGFVKYDSHIPSNLWVYGIEKIKYDINYSYIIRAISSKNTAKPLVNIQTHFVNGKYKIIFLKYNKDFDLWFISESDLKYLIVYFSKSMFLYVLLFSIIQIVTVLLFKQIKKSEDSKINYLLRQNNHDILTSLPNRRYIQENKSSIIKKDSPLSAIHINIDNFKNINNIFGHTSGDKVIKEVSRRIKKASNKEDLIVNLSGDDFILFTSINLEKELQCYSKKIMNAISETYNIDHSYFKLSTSIGISRYPENANDLDSLLNTSYIAMYEAKKSRNSICFFKDILLDIHREKILIEQQLSMGLVKNEFFIVYQPQLDKNGNIYGIEALLRWKNEGMGFISPEKFIPVAESSGIMPRLGDFVIEKVLNDLNILSKVISYKLRVSINISVKQVLMEGFIGKLKSYLAFYEIHPSTITVEITESLFINDLDHVIPILNELRKIGVNISMDDFGTGYSSLNVLSVLPIDELKIDKTFIDKMQNDNASIKMIHSIISIARNYNMSVVAEGVEREEQKKILISLGCDHFQGYYFSKPLGIIDLRNRLTRSLELRTE